MGDYRREGAESAGLGQYQPASFFDPSNEEASMLRQKASERCLSDLISWMTTTAAAHVNKGDGKYVSPVPRSPGGASPPAPYARLHADPAATGTTTPQHAERHYHSVSP